MHLAARYTVWSRVTYQVVSPTNLSYWQLFPLSSYYKACLDVLNYLYNWTQWLLIATDQPMCKPGKKIYHFQIMQFVFSFNDVYTAACLAFSVPIATIFVPSGFDCQSVSYHELVSQHVTILLISFIPRECVCLSWEIEFLDSFRNVVRTNEIARLSVASKQSMSHIEEFVIKFVKHCKIRYTIECCD